MKLKAAVIGLGRMGAEPSSRLEGRIPDGWLPLSHIESILSNDQLDMTAICDSDIDRVNRFSSHYNVVNVYSDYKELIADVKPDFLCVATRTLGRSDIIRYACENDVKIIYAEKPLSRSIADCAATLDSIMTHDVVFGYGVNRRYHATYRKAKEILKSGELGDLKEIIVEHGRTQLLWSHPHSTDIILFFSGTTELDFIQGTCLLEDNFQPGTDLLVDNDPIVENGFFQFTNGVSASITQVGGWNVRLACSKGILTIYADGTYIELLKGDGYFTKREVINVIPERSATVTAFDDLLNSFNYKSQPPISLEEIKTGLIMLNGLLFSSINEGKRIKPENIPASMVITGKSGNLYA